MPPKDFAGYPPANSMVVPPELARTAQVAAQASPLSGLLPHALLTIAHAIAPSALNHQKVPKDFMQHLFKLVMGQHLFQEPWQEHCGNPFFWEKDYRSKTTEDYKAHNMVIWPHVCFSDECSIAVLQRNVQLFFGFKHTLQWVGVLVRNGVAPHDHDAAFILHREDATRLLKTPELMSLWKQVGSNGGEILTHGRNGHTL